MRALVLALLVLTLRRLPPAGAGWRSPIALAAAAYLAALLLATAFSREPRVSLLGALQRQQGLLTQACYPLLFLLTAASLRGERQVRRLWRTLAWASAPIVAYGLAQAAGLDPLGWRTDGASPVLATLGRSNFMGSYLVLVMPLTAALLWGGGRRWPVVLLLAGQAVCLLATHARASWLGLAAAVAVFAAGWLPRARWRLPALGGLAALALAGGAAALALPATAGSWAARLTIWRACLRLLAARPLLGYGPESLQTAFYAVFPPQLVYYQGRGVVVDRAHNLWLDVGLSAGALGLAAFVALLAYAVRAAWRGYAAAADRGERIAWLALLAAIAGHVVDLQLSFDLTATATVFWLLLALVVAMGSKPAALTAGEEPARTRPAIAWLLPTAAALLLAAVTVVLPLAADTSAGLADSGTPLAERIERAATAVRLWPVEPQYHQRLGLLLLAAGDLAGADRQMAAAVALRPADPMLWLAQGGVYAYGAGDAARLRLAEAAYRQAIALAPSVARAHVALAQALAAEGRLGEAAASLSRAIELDATDYYAYELLAAVDTALGLTDAASRATADAGYWRARTAPDAAASPR